MSNQASVAGHGHLDPLKACPVVLRQRAGWEILAFEHPLAGRQLVKGGIEPGETPAQAAVRELREEAGLRSVVVADLGPWASGWEGQAWSFQVCAPVGELPDAWVHHAPDDGGHDFRFFWQVLDEPPAGSWHPVYLRALAHLREVVPAVLARQQLRHAAPRACLALSIVAPAGTRIASGEKSLEVRTWVPDVVPLHDLLIVQNHRFLTVEDGEDPDGEAVALVDVVRVRPWSPDDVAAACSSGWQPGYYAWELTNVRPLPRMRVPARRRLYAVHVDLTTATEVRPKT